MTLYIFNSFKLCYIFRTLSLSFYYTHYCKILLYRIIYYIVNRQFSLVAATFLQINYLSIYLSIYLSYHGGNFVIVILIECGLASVGLNVIK